MPKQKMATSDMKLPEQVEVFCEEELSVGDESATVACSRPVVVRDAKAGQVCWRPKVMLGEPVTKWSEVSKVRMIKISSSAWQFFKVGTAVEVRLPAVGLPVPEFWCAAAVVEKVADGGTEVKVDGTELKVVVDAKNIRQVPAENTARQEFVKKVLPTPKSLFSAERIVQTNQNLITVADKVNTTTDGVCSIINQMGAAGDPEIAIIGTPEAVKKAAASVTAGIKQHTAAKREVEEATRRITVQVGYEEAALGLIVGKAGANLKKCKQQSRVKDISVEREEGVISITGTPEQIEVAKAFVQVKWGAAYMPAAAAAGLTEHALQEIKSKTGLVVIEVGEPVDGGEDVGEYCEVALAGNDGAVELATHWIHENFEGAISAKIPIDPQLRSILVGKGGQNLAKAKSASGVACLNVEEDHIGVVGTPEQIEMVKPYLELVKGSEVVAADIVALIFGGEQRRQLKSKSGLVKLEVAAAEDGYHTVSFVGSADSVEQANIWLQDNLTTMIKERVPFDASLRHDVIGPKGANLKACKDATGVKLIDVDRKEAYTTVVGAEYQVTEAKKFLGLTKGTLQVETSLQRTVLAGPSLAKLRKVFGIKRVDVGRAPRGATEVTVTLIGPDEAVQEATYHLLDQQADFATRTVTVPERAVAFLIGAKGVAVRALAANTACQVKVQDKAAAARRTDGRRNITLSGTPEAVEDAEFQVNVQVQLYMSEQKTKGKGKGKGEGGGGGRGD